MRLARRVTCASHPGHAAATLLSCLGAQVVLSLAIPAVHDPAAAQDFLLLSSAALYGLLPLLFRPQEYLAKVLLVVAHQLLAWWGLHALHYRVAICGAGVGEGVLLAGRGTGVLRTGQAPGWTGQAQGEASGPEAGGGSQGLRGGRLGLHEKDGQEGDEEGVGHGKAEWPRLYAGGAAASDHVSNGAVQAEALQGGAAGAPVDEMMGQGEGSLVPALARLYMGGFVLLEAYCSLLHPALLGSRLPFLPLMLTSMYCAVGVGWVWMRMLLGMLPTWRNPV